MTKMTQFAILGMARMGVMTFIRMTLSILVILIYYPWLQTVNKPPLFHFTEYHFGECCGAANGLAKGSQLSKKSPRTSVFRTKVAELLNC